MTDDVVDFSYALMFYDPAFTSPNWARTAVIYQIFPDRFRNGDPHNDPQDGDIRYDDPVITLGWGELPEGYCRHYADATTNCPWRFDTTPPAWSPTIEGPRGRDYYGGDLAGVIEQLDYLQQLGITTIYFNPIFAAGSNHRYDTRDYYRIDPYLGNNGTFAHLVQEARRRGIRVILDSVFNHMSSDTPSSTAIAITRPWVPASRWPRHIAPGSTSARIMFRVRATIMSAGLASTPSPKPTNQTRMCRATS